MASQLQIADPPALLDPLGRPLIGPCLLWQAGTDINGYGRVTNYGAFGTRAPQLTHRVNYALHYGIDLRKLAEVPPLDHLCRVHACCSAAHLEPVTRPENLHRGKLARPTCRAGHDYVPGSFSMEGGSRRCLVCKRAQRHRALNRPLMSQGRRRADGTGRRFE